MFIKQGRMPVTNETILNDVSHHKDFHLSFNPSVRDFGCETTALVLGNHALFFILKGDHREGLEAAAEAGGKQGAIDYVIDHLDETHEYSNHRQIGGNHPVLAYKDHAEEHLSDAQISAITAHLEASAEESLDVEEDSPQP